MAGSDDDEEEKRIKKKRGKYIERVSKIH